MIKWSRQRAQRIRSHPNIWSWRANPKQTKESLECCVTITPPSVVCQTSTYACIVLQLLQQLAQSAEHYATWKGLADTCGNSPKNLQEQQFFRRLQKVEQVSSRAKRYLLQHHQLLLSFFQIPILARLSHSHSRNSNGIGLDCCFVCSRLYCSAYVSIF